MRARHGCHGRHGGAGQSWTEPPNDHHILSANVSKTEGARLIVYIIADDGAQPTVYAK